MNEEKRWDGNTIQKILCIGLAIFCLVTILNISLSIKNMQQELSMLRQEVNNLHSSISIETGGISSNIDASLKEENSIISDYSYQVKSDKINREEKTIPLNLSVRPKDIKTD